MASRATVLSSVLIATNGAEGPKWFKSTGTGIFIGYLCEYEDADEVVVSPTSKAEVLAGIAGCPSYHDNTANFAANARVPVWLIGCGAEVWCTHDASGAVTVRHGDPITYSATTAGLVLLDTVRDIDTIGTATRYTYCDTANTNIRLLMN